MPEPMVLISTTKDDGKRLGLPPVISEHGFVPIGEEHMWRVATDDEYRRYVDYYAALDDDQDFMDHHAALDDGEDY